MQSDVCCRALIPALSIALCFACGTASAQSLRDLFVAALTEDPALAASEAQMRASEERVTQARAPLLPTLQATASASDSKFNSSNEAAEDRTFKSARWGVQLTQPLVRLDSFAGLDSAKTELEGARIEVEAAAADVASRVSTAYFEVLGARETLLSLTREKLAAEVQLAAARGSFQRGKVAMTDVLEAEAAYDIAAAKTVAATGDLALKRDALRQLVGDIDFELGVLDVTAPDPAAMKEPLPLLVEEALERNPTADQARLRWKASEAEIRKARRAHLPTLDLVVSYSSEDSEGTPSNPIPVQGDTVQAQASLTVPIFAGLGTQAKVGEAVALHDKLGADVEAAERKVVSDVRESYYAMSAALAQIASEQTAERSAATAVRARRKGYRVGTSTTADVLKAESQYAQARRDLMKAKLDARLNRLKLQIALGRPWRESVDELSDLLIPESKLPPDDFDIPREGAT